jgi:competence ComEA-like helix-hairpin-helix protein
MLYSRAQLRLLIVVAAILLVGLGVREWRQRFPEAALRLERFDQPAPPPPPTSPPAQLGGAPSALSTTDGPPSGAPNSSGARPSGSSSHRERPEILPPVVDPRPLDLNRATVNELARLPGVGPSLARRIFDERERRGGRFDSPEALRQVMGVGPKKLAALRDLVTVGE